MDEIFFHVPQKQMFTLRYLFPKEEEIYCPILREFHFEMMTGNFFEKINYLEKTLIEEEEFNLEKIKSRKILKFIKIFKEEHYKNVMEKNKYSCRLFVSKNQNKDFGFLGWIPKFKSKYLISLKDFDYDKKKKYCHLTEEEEKFNFKYQRKFDFLSLFFKKEYFYDGRYNIPTVDIIKFKRKYIKEIRDKCCHGNFVCPTDNLCRGHKFIFFLEKVFEAITHSVVEEKIFYRYFLFNNFKNRNDEVFSWDFIPAEPKDLSHLSYSKRLSFLN